VTTRSTERQAGWVRQLWLGGLALVLLATGVALVLRAMFVDRSMHERFEQALRLAQWALQLQHVTADLRSPQIHSHTPAGADALAEARALLSRMHEADLTENERARLATLDGEVAKLDAGSTDTAGRDTDFERIDDALAGLLAAVRQRTAEAAAEAASFHDLARAGLLAAAALAVLFGVALALLMMRALTESRRQLGHLGQLAHEDSLTGILNRRGLDDRLPLEIARAQRTGAALTVAMLDLDYFKRFNDKRGHAAGDALLRNAAQAWRKQLRPTDLLARYGGEEFTLVLPACDADQAAQLIERLRPEMPERQTFSAGVAQWNGADALEELLRTADMALLQAKRSGRNRTIIAGREPQMALPLKLA
jgi:diguanylate cyclase (GGDEF)-like protein